MSSALRAASQLPRRGPTDVDVTPVCMLIKNLMIIMMMIYFRCITNERHRIQLTHFHMSHNLETEVGR